MRSKLLLTTLLLCATVGCTDKKAATSSNFEAAINNYLSYGKTCVVYDAAFSMLPSSPMTANAAYDLLVNSGMISKSPAPSKGGPPLFVYDLTDKAKATKTTVRFSNRLVTGYLCSGNLAVDKIGPFTEPADNSGKRESKVTFTTKLVNVPKWLEDSSMAKWSASGPVPTKPDSKLRESATMVLTSEGWRVDQIQQVTEDQ